jgi:hypothetical protein
LIVPTDEPERVQAMEDEIFWQDFESDRIIGEYGGVTVAGIDDSTVPVEVFVEHAIYLLDSSKVILPVAVANFLLQ